jgi:glycosyltransferase involved in cell wall biosynthesis
LCLIAIGKDKYNPQIIKKITADINRRLGREGIIYKEYVPEDKLCQLYANAKLLIYVSSKEAFGLPPLEALAYGVPAVVADEQINHEIYGENSFFASPVRGRLSTKTTASSNGTGAYTAETIAGLRPRTRRGLSDHRLIVLRNPDTKKTAKAARLCAVSVIKRSYRTEPTFDYSLNVTTAGT